MPVATSKSLRTSTELLLIADIKPGLVQLSEPMTYATRLEKFFEALFALRKRAVELEGSGFIGPLERLRTLHFVRFAIFDDQRRLLLAVTFDKPWEPYIRTIVDDAGPILDVICSHCVGFENSTSKHGYPAFARWVHEHQIEANFFHAGFPEESVDDIQYLRNLKGLVEDGKSGSQLALDAAVPPQIVTKAPTPQSWATFDRALVALFRLRTRFPADPADAVFSDQAIYDRAASLILSGLGPRELAKALEKRSEDERVNRIPPQIVDSYNGIDKWLETLLAQLTVTADKPAAPKPRAEQFVERRVQGIVHPGYEGMTHGCLVLLRFHPEPEKTLELLAYLSKSATSGIDADEPKAKFNVGVTRAGLSRLGFGETLLKRFPVEFRQGLEARAGLIGDVGTNHPEHWQRPINNWPEEGGDEVDLNTVDAVVILQINSPDVNGDHVFAANHPLRPEVGQLEKHGAAILHVQPLRRYFEEGGSFLDHFGFVEGIGQPDVTGKPANPGEPYNNNVALGELLIGHLDDHGDEEDFGGDEQLRRLQFDGSYLVIRKLAQHVKVFDNVVQGWASQTGVDARTIEKKLMGRDRDGEPATPLPLAKGDDRNLNDFNYGKPPRKDDPYDVDVKEEPYDDGAGCPLQSHIRLANPRLHVDKSVHGRPKRVPRIVRRGFSYGPKRGVETEAERGLLFMACNAKMAEQYEVIQRWLNGGNSTGLHSSRKDPVTGAHEQGKGPHFTFKHKDKVHSLKPADKPFVQLRWGLYAFVPSMQCLKDLPDLSKAAIERAKASAPPGLSYAIDAPRGTELDPDAQARFRRGTALLYELQSVERSAAQFEWKKVLEDAARREDALAVWAAIRAQGGVLRTPYGVLVGNHDRALEVLRDEQRFSVREYWRRMRNSSMTMYLGMDARPEARAVCPFHPATGRAVDQDYVDAVRRGEIVYERVKPANEYIAGISRVYAFLVAFDATRRALHQVRWVALAKDQARVTVDLVVLADQAVSDVAQHYFGVPDGDYMRRGGQPTTDDDPQAYCPSDFTVASQYIFRANPDSWTETLSLKRGQRVDEAARKVVAAAAHDAHPFVRMLRHRFENELKVPKDQIEGEVVRSLVGAVDGFVAANWGSFISTMKQWIDRDDLARSQPFFKAFGDVYQQAAIAISDNFWPDAKSRAGEAELLAAMEKTFRTPEALDTKSKLGELIGKLAHGLGDAEPFAQRVTDTLKIFPVPAWLHRTATVKTMLGSEPIEPGDNIVLHLGSAALEQPGPGMLFGGPYTLTGGVRAKGEPLHTCAQGGSSRSAYCSGCWLRSCRSGICAAARAL